MRVRARAPSDRARQARASKEAARLRQLVADTEAERDAARAAEQAERQSAHAASLELQTLQKASGEAGEGGSGGDGGGGGGGGGVEKEHREALVRLGSAEQKARLVQQEVRTLKNASKALEAEVEEVTQVYEEVQARSDELRQTLGLKEEALNRAKADKLRADHVGSILKAEHAALQDKVEKLAAQGESLEKVRASYEAQLRKAAEVARKRDEEARAFEQHLTQHKASLKEAQAQAQHAASLLTIAKEAEERAAGREKAAHALAATEQTSAKRLAAERDQLAKRVTRLAASDPSGGREASAASSELSEQLEYYRLKVKCSLCLRNDKDAIISKCMHAFCRDCIQKRLDVRNRKCPACALQFDYQSVKDLFLTS